MRRFLALRLLRMVPALWAILSAIFLLSRSVVPEPQLASRLADSSMATHSATAAERRLAELQLRQRLGLTEPLFYFSQSDVPAQGIAWRWQWNGASNQYHHWLTRLLSADLGLSFRDNQPVTQLLLQSLRYTLPLTAGAAVAAVALTWGLVPRLVQKRRARRLMLSSLYGLDALPLFVMALLLLLLLANPDILAIFPAYGLGYEDSTRPWLVRASTYAYHLTLPLLALTLASLPPLMVQLDSSLRHELQADYVLTAKSKGLTNRSVVGHHALRNALLPTLTLLTELLPGLVAGSVVVEVVFSLPGMGRLLAEAAAAHDYPVLLGGILLIALVRLLAQVLADWFYFQVDPRIRLPT